jgi:hypothetical protein
LGGERFSARVGAVFVTALFAYALALYFFFPGYIALPVPYHPDMYWAVNFAARGLSAVDFLSAPRPLFYETLLLAGHLGLVGSLLFLDAIVLLDLALVVALLERTVLGRRLPWLIVLGTLLLAMVGPGFFKQPAYDVGFHVAFLFGLLGVCAWELRWAKHEIASLFLSGLFFVLSGLANEGVIPALLIYAAVAAWRNRRSLPIAVLLAGLPLLAMAASFWDSQFTHSPFVKLSAESTYQYKIDLSLSSVLACARFYAAPLMNAGFLTLLAVSGLGLWLRRRFMVGVAFVVAALSLYLPYCVLPNHLDVTYQWVSMPLFMLLVPLAWAAARNERISGAGVSTAARAALVAALGFAIAFQSTQSLQQKHWNEIALAQNRAVLVGLGSLKQRIRASHNVIVCGLAFGRWPFMQSAAFLSREFDFRGEWTVASEPGFRAIDYQPNARPIDYGRIRWSDYDLIVIFNRDGRLTRAYSKKQFAAEIARRGLEKLSNRGLVDSLGLYYPPGIIPPRSAADGERQGIYLETAPNLCCFLADRASFRLRKPAAAAVVVFSFDVPHTEPFAGRPELVSIFFNGAGAGTQKALNAGVHRLRFRLTPSQAKSSQIIVTMHMSISYIPKQIGMNDDTRRLSIKLLRVGYRR